jgi:hypothetical protein
MLAGDKALPPVCSGTVPAASVASGAVASGASVAGSTGMEKGERELIIYYILRLYLFFY